MHFSYMHMCRCRCACIHSFHVSFSVSFFHSLWNRSFIVLLSFREPYILCAHFSRTTFWLNSRKVATFFSVPHPLEMYEKKLGENFYWFFIWVLFIFVFVIRSSSAVQCICMRACMHWISSTFSEKKKTRNNFKTLTTTHRKQCVPSKAWPIFAEVVIIVCLPESNAMLMNWKLEASSATVSICLDFEEMKKHKKNVRMGVCVCQRDKHNEVNVKSITNSIWKFIVYEGPPLVMLLL